METLLFMIIIGILSAIFGKRKGNNGPSRRKSFMPDHIGEVRRLFHKQLENNTQRNSARSIVKEKESQPFKGERAEEKDRRNIEEFEDVAASFNLPQEMEPDHSKPPHVPLHHQPETEGPLFSENPDPKTLISGIIWSEILGEPRSKRPYAARKRE